MKKDFIRIIKTQDEHLQRVLKFELAVVEINEEQNTKIDTENQNAKLIGGYHYGETCGCNADSAWLLQ